MEDKLLNLMTDNLLFCICMFIVGFFLLGGFMALVVVTYGAALLLPLAYIIYKLRTYNDS